MNLHILGICGTFMAGIAQIARQLDHRVTGSDANTYPPMSTLLESLGIVVKNGYRPEHIPDDVDMCIVGNAMTRGNPEVEHMLDAGIPFMSGPEWLHRHVLTGRSVIAVAGTHGKTTTTSMLCHVFETLGHDCGFLVGGVPGNFTVSARLGTSPWFVIEADEYDTAFFDKRSKFVHYHPRIAILNNLEFDHADIFSSLEDIKTQVHHLVRIIPQSGTVVVNADDANLDDALARGCWSRLVRFSPSASATAPAWRIESTRPDYGVFDIVDPAGNGARVSWELFGAHNAANALAAAAACDAAGIPVALVADALGAFDLPRRRLQRIGEGGGIVAYEDFAHHPTAIRKTLDALVARHPEARILAVIEPRSNTMQRGVHNAELGDILARCDRCMMLRGPDMKWDPGKIRDTAGHAVCEGFDSAPVLLETLLDALGPGDVVVLMSNGSFQGIPAELSRALATRGKSTAAS